MEKKSLPKVIFDFWELEENNKYIELGNKVISKCLELENIQNKNLYVTVIFTVPSRIKAVNNEYRNINKETDVLSFPMLEKEEIFSKKDGSSIDTLGDIIISIEQVERQALQYGHSFERELAYMIVHGFYHLIGYDHMIETDKLEMRKKEEFALKQLNIVREDS